MSSDSAAAALPRMRVARRAPAVTSLIGIIAFAFFVSAAGFGWLLGAFDAGVASPAIATAPASASFSICARASDTDCVVDGDTFRYDGRIIRIADIDTPETRDAMCAGERALGEQAKHRLRALLNAGPFTIAPYERSTDQYGRDLRIIRRNSESVGMVLVSEGLARAWDGRRHPWC
jgi:endonuclease YncB( thermonuclease family)